MIVVKPMGRIGNSLFLISIGLYISKQTGFSFALTSGIGKGERKMYYPDKIYPFEFFKNFTILDEDYDLSSYRKIMNPKKYSSFKDLPLEDNIIICDWFLSKVYVDYNTIKDVFVPSKELKEEIFDLYNPTRNTLSINVRRGDFLWDYHKNRGYQCLSKEYFENAYKSLEKKYDKILITSDDLDWCKQNLTFEDNIIFVEKNTNNSSIFFDLFLPSFVGDHIISPSTFSWWSAFLNNNLNKIVIMPYPWNTVNTESGYEKFYLNTTKIFDTHTFTEIKH